MTLGMLLRDSTVSKLTDILENSDFETVYEIVDASINAMHKYIMQALEVRND